MAKKSNESNKPIKPTPVLPNVPVPEEDPPVYEAEAYGAPQPDEGADVTVLKPVGMGGPVPIVAPKHNTIQLQPIVVPLAVVPYMTQDSSVLRTDGRQQSDPYGGIDGEPAAIKNNGKDGAKSDGGKTANKVAPRIFALISFLLAAVAIVPYILCYEGVTVGKLNFLDFRTLLYIESLVQKVETFSFSLEILGMVTMAMIMISALIALIGLIVGKYPKPLVCITQFIALGCLAAELIIDLVHHEFIVEEKIGFVVMFAVVALSFILSVVFALTINRMNDKEPDKQPDKI